MLPEVESFVYASEFPTYVDLLRHRALQQPNQYAYTFLVDGEKEELNVTYEELDRKARAIAAVLQRTVAPGDRALLLYPSGLDYVFAFYGCLYAGVAAVPAYPPSQNKHLARIQAIIADAQAKIVLTTEASLSKLQRSQELISELESLSWLTTDEGLDGEEEGWQMPAINGETTAFLQYTSGSTSIPKGVIVSHRNLMHNNWQQNGGMGLSSGMTIVCWLPLFHDMGMIGNMIMALYAGVRCILIAPQTFLQKPARWLQAVSTYRAYMTCAPNFAYDLCVQRVTPEQMKGVDLSCCKLAVSGAEAVRYQTLVQFWEKFVPYGFQWETFAPGYGLAEATLAVSLSSVGEATLMRYIDSDLLKQGKVVQVSADDEKGQAVVGCGRALAGQQLVIVDPETCTKCAGDQVGEIWLSGAAVTQGYWMRSEENAETFQAYLVDGSGPFLRTGDLGFICEEQVFIAGRIKDLIIIRGRNHYPQDIELTVEEAHPALRRSGGAAFSIDIDGQEQLVIVQEVDRAYSDDVDMQRIFQSIRASVLRQHELHTYAIALIKHNTIPKTSSGKIQRRACRQQFLTEELSFLDVSVAVEDSETQDFYEGYITRDNLLVVDAQEQFSLLVSYIAAQFSRILKVDVRSSFDLECRLSNWGLDSLKASALKSQLESDLGVDIPVVALLQDPQIGELAQFILAQITEQDQSADAALIQPQGPREYYPLSFSQEQIWFLTQFEPESTFYNMPFIVHIKGKLSLPALEWSINKIVERHETLRMVFDVEDGFPIQRVQPPSWIPLLVKDLTSLSRPQEEIYRFSHEETARLFDLSRGPLLRAMIMCLPDNEYRLQITFHHIICDGSSLNVLLQEINAFYQFYTYQDDATLIPPALPIRYTDYVLWHRDWLQGERLEAQLSYWRHQLKDLKPLELPADRQRPPVPNYQGERIHFTLPENLRQGLKSLAHQTGATFFMVIVSTLMLLLARYSGQRDVAVGTLVANRTRKEVERLIGCFINTLVLRGDLALDQSFLDLLQQIRQTVFDAYANQDVAFEKVVEELRPDRHLSHFPFFQVMLVLQSIFQGSIENEAVTFEPFEGENDATIHDLYISATETDQGVDCLVRYNTDIFEHATILRLLTHWQTLMENVVADPSQQLSAIAMLSESEYRQMVTEWNNTALDYPLQKVYQELFSAQVQRTPQAPAATCCGRTLSYQELDALSNRLARALRAMGVGPEVLVGIYMERSLEMLVSILAIFKAGGAYLPLDLHHPSQRVRFMLHESQARLIITQPHLCGHLAAKELTVFTLDDAWQAIASYSDQPLPASNTPENLAYVIYTSGSTGVPKGAMICQKGMINHLMAKIDALQIQANDILAQNASQCFDISVWQFLAALLVGGQTHIVPDEVALNPASLFSEVVEGGITILELVPTYMQALLDYIQERGQQRNPKISLRWIVPTGEACSLRLVNHWLRLFPHIPLLNVYGTTESSDDTLHAVIDSTSRRQWQSVPIGRPVPNTQVYVLDEQLAVVPIGVPGSIYLGGVCVGRGYLKEPERTALAFIPSPFVPGERLYKTGDLGYYLPDGQIGFVGRVDHQIKLRGYRIELGEIEAVLEQHPAVKESAVSVSTSSTSRGGNDRLVAYVVKLDQAVSEDDLRTYLLQKLPEYMCPSHFMFLESLPLTANGKVDRHSLPEPETTGGVQEAFVAPRNALEEALAGMWQEILGREQVSVMDNFFHLGGHSLLAALMLARLREQLNVDIPLRRLFEGPTIASLASQLESEQQQVPAMDPQE